MKDDYQTAKASAGKLRDDLLEMAKRALAPDHPKDVMKPDDLNALCNGKLFLESGFRDVTRIVDQSNLGKLGHEAIQQIIRGAFLIGACATYTDSQKAFVRRMKDDEQTDKMRAAKANTDEKKALEEAISAERGTGPVDHPSKEAAAILDAVNKRLESRNHPPVKVDAIYRRLKKVRAL
jgi:hypothetical protein